MKKLLETGLLLFAVYGFWGMIYPDLCFTTEVCQQIEEDNKLSTGEAAGTVITAEEGQTTAPSGTAGTGGNSQSNVKVQTSGNAEMSESTQSSRNAEMSESTQSSRNAEMSESTQSNRNAESNRASGTNDTSGIMLYTQICETPYSKFRFRSRLLTILQTQFLESKDQNNVTSMQ